MKTTLETAIEFLDINAYTPALESSTLSENVKKNVKKSQRQVASTKKVGDIYRYLKRYTIGDDYEDGNTTRINIHKELKSHGLMTLEECLPIFEKRFANDIYDATTLESLVIGMSYTSYDLANASGCYNIVPGIVPIGKVPNCKAVFVKGQIDGDRYENRWIIPGIELQYYFYKHNGNYDPTYDYNEAILKSPKVPIYVFIKGEFDYQFKGIFTLVKPVFETDGKNWFHLRKVDVIPKSVGILDAEYQRSFQEQLDWLHRVSDAELDQYLREESEHVYEQVIYHRRKRNPAVVEATLRRAKGTCEGCNLSAPFNRTKDGSPYLEVHHVVFMNRGGHDNIDNTLALCPNCHRKKHFGE